MNCVRCERSIPFDRESDYIGCDLCDRCVKRKLRELRRTRAYRDYIKSWKERCRQAEVEVVNPTPRPHADAGLFGYIQTKIDQSS